MKNVYVNGEYIHNFLKEKRLNLSGVSRDMGFSKGYIQNALALDKMDTLALKYICQTTGMDYEVATTPPGKAEENKATGNQGTAMSMEAAEIVVEYMKDLGKILSDIIREVREDRTQNVEQLNGIKKELHELSVSLKSGNAEMAQKTRAIHNAIHQINNTSQALLDVTRAKK